MDPITSGPASLVWLLAGAACLGTIFLALLVLVWMNHRSRQSRL